MAERVRPAEWKPHWQDVRRAAAAAVAVLLSLATPAAAMDPPPCGGEDLMARLERNAPEQHAGILARAHEVPNARGLFWRVETEGATPSFLYGTVHSTEAASRGLPSRVAKALAASRMLFVELTPEEQEELETRLTEDPTYALNTTGPVLSERVDARTLEEAKAVLAARGLPLSAAERLKPWVLLSMIAIPRCEQSRIAAGMPVLDDRIAEIAQGAGLPIRGLETYEDAFAAFDRLTEQEMTTLLVDGFVTADVEEDLRRTLESLYSQGEVAAIMEFNIWYSESRGRIPDSRASGAALQRALMVGRNRRWMSELVPELRKGGVFAAFGALHLPGEEGVVELLRERGFTVTRIPL